VAVEMQSLSKSHNLAGWRIGFAAGSAEAIANLGRVKSNVDFSVFGAIQMAAVAALAGDQRVCAANRARYRRRRDRLVAGFARLGWPVAAPRATLYLWARIPAAWGDDDMAFVRDVFEATGVLLSPGSGFGSYGKGYARASLVVDEARCDRVLKLLGEADLPWR
jgi:LL-diaminopimelate aminotransferase